MPTPSDSRTNAPGRFIMGSPASEPNRGSDETLHEVSLERGFWLGRTEVTRAQWERVMGPAELHPEKPNPFRHLSADLPMVSVSFHDIQAYLDRLEALAPGHGFRLPTEAEWEYACRAGTSTAFSTGPRLPGSHAAFQDQDDASLVRAGSYPANPWGLHDMHGNVWEWTSDWYAPYPASPAAAPRGPDGGSLKVIRGGSWPFAPTAPAPHVAITMPHTTGVTLSASASCGSPIKGRLGILETDVLRALLWFCRVR